MLKTAKIFAARKILTLNPDCPSATHVVVDEGKIVALGSEQDMSSWDLPIDDQFIDNILMPGFVEAHAHVMCAEVWRYTYLGYDQQFDPAGCSWSGITDQQQAIDRLKVAERELNDPQTPLIAWQYDPIFWQDQHKLLDRWALDQVSTTRPVLVMHASGHIINVNSTLLNLANLNEDLDIEGLMRDSHGKLTGELRDLATQFAVLRATGNPLFGEADLGILEQYAKLATNVGVTTASELYASLDDDSLASYKTASNNKHFPLRFYTAQNAETLSIEQGLERLNNAQKHCNEKLYIGSCKLIVDGSIQSFTARLAWPGYHNGAANGAWKQAPQTMHKMIHDYHKAGVQLHIHVNGDQAIELVLDILEEVLSQYPRADHRHTLQHCQLASEAQYRRIAKLGLCVNLFSNHLYYWGDQHKALTVGPSRVQHMNAAASALKHKVPLAIHSDAPVTPLNPLFTAWCATNRISRSGAVYGEAQKITVLQALHALTLGAAYTLKLDHLVGSIEVGKFADFAVLDEDPLEVGCMSIKDINVWGTVVSGIAHKAAQRRS